MRMEAMSFFVMVTPPAFAPLTRKSENRNVDSLTLVGPL